MVQRELYVVAEQSSIQPQVNTISNSEMGKIRVLFVDDEAGIRMTLPVILQRQGFDVTVAGSVPEALEVMGHQKFEVLLTDLNIGDPADGFVLVSAMRRIQPTAATFILTGYPDFQTALEAIRKQVDDYFTKPADISSLVTTLREKALRPRELSRVPTKRLALVIRENTYKIIACWTEQVRKDSRIAAIPSSEAERNQGLARLLEVLAAALEAHEVQIPAEEMNAAAIHGKNRARQGYTIPLLVAETRILNRVIAEILHENLLSMDLSTLIWDTLKLGEFLQAILEESTRAFQEMEKVSPRSKRANGVK
jgi:ActR/RegA family two-component response regulator